MSQTVSSSWTSAHEQDEGLSLANDPGSSTNHPVYKHSIAGTAKCLNVKIKLIMLLQINMKQEQLIQVKIMLS